MQKPAYPIHSYPWYVHDWRQSRMRLRLSPLGRYVFRELLDQCYIDGSIPDDEKLLARIVDIPISKFNTVWPEVRSAFELREDGNLHHSKADVVLEDIVRWKEQRSNAGRASGQSRRTNAKRPLNDRSTDVEASTTTTTTTTKGVPPPDDFFEVLYARHPKKKNRLLAEQALAAALSETPDRPALMAKIDGAHQVACQSRDWTKSEGDYCETLDRWLMRKGWLDLQVKAPPPAEPNCIGTEADMMERILKQREATERRDREREERKRAHEEQLKRSSS